MKLTRFLLVQISTLLLHSTVFASPDYETLKAELKERASRGVDLYAEEYKGIRKSSRFPEAVYQDERYVLLDNFRDLGDRGMEGIEDPVWTSALIDTSKVKRVLWMMCVFVIKVGPLKYDAGHAQMVFEFENGGAILADRELDGIVNSFEIMPAQGEVYDPIGKGMKRYYDNSCTLGSKRFSFLASASRDSRIEIYTLDLTKEEMVRLLKISLKEAFDKESIRANKYHTTRNSCVTNQFRILNLFLPEKIRIPEWKRIFGLKYRRTFGTIVPRRVKNTLRKHKIITKEEIYKCPDEAMVYLDQMKKRTIFSTLYK